ncbi:MAG TPA: hypothetical protein VG206_10800 [Terriglobia bacterium]|nr:hypothetical protein [Terriglobia bacterium]
MPAIVLGIVALFPWWYWTAYNNTNCAQEHSDVKGLPSFATCQQLNADTKAGQAYSETHEPWYGPEWVLVYVGFLYTIFALGQWWSIARQSNESSKQAAIMKSQLTLQEIGFQQWLEFDSWKIRENTPSQGTRILTFEVLVANKTNFPLTLDSVSIVVYLDHEWHNDVVPNYVVPPLRGYYPIDAIAFLNQAEEVKYQTGSLVMKIGGKATYINCLKQTVTVDFGQICVCGDKVPPRFILHAGTGQQTKIEKGD